MGIYSYNTIEIDTKALLHNVQILRQKTGPKVKLAAVVKDDAYGHGAVEISKILEIAKIDYLAVNSVEEGKILRNNKIKPRIMIMAGLLKDEISDLITHGLEPAIYTDYMAELINREASKHNKKIPIHIKIDTGMNRLGIRKEEVLGFISKLSKLKNIEIAGIMSHLPDYNNKNAAKQISSFKKIIPCLNFKRPPMLHIANSGTAIFHKNAHLDMIRCGISIYGYLPKKCEESKLFQPILSLKSKILTIKTVKKGESVSYNRNFTAKKNMTVAVVPVGYADGYHKLYSKFGKVLINGRFTKIVGDICMDMFMVDVSNFKNICPLDEVTLIGKNKNKEISAYDFSAAGFIPYEVLTSLPGRIRRIYI